MATPHPKYPNILVYDGAKGETPVVGAFYLPKSGDTMLKIAGKAWGSAYSSLSNARLLNANPWNMAHLIYRNSDSNCKAAMDRIGMPEAGFVDPFSRESQGDARRGARRLRDVPRFFGCASACVGGAGIRGEPDARRR